MSVQIAYRAETVAPIVKRIINEGDGLVGIHEDDLDFSKLVSRRPTAPVPLPAPPDPLLAVWRDANTAATDFVNLNPQRGVAVATGIDFLIGKLNSIKAAAAVPAPVAPPVVPQARWEPNVLVRWGSRREGKADIEINTATAVGLARDKKESRRQLGTLSPSTWFRSADVILPAVVRPRRHHAGKRFFVCTTRQELDRAITRCGPGWYATKLIDKSAEYRVFILQGRVIRLSEKTAPDDGGVAWNVGVGATATGMARKNWPLNVIKVALKAAQRLSLDWTAVDVIVGTDGTAYVLEANTAPGLASGSRALEQIAWAFGWVAKNDAPNRLDIDGITKWQDVLHPSLLDSATDAN